MSTSQPDHIISLAELLSSAKPATKLETYDGALGFDPTDSWAIWATHALPNRHAAAYHFGSDGDSDLDKLSDALSNGNKLSYSVPTAIPKFEPETPNQTEPKP